MHRHVCLRFEAAYEQTSVPLMNGPSCRPSIVVRELRRRFIITHSWLDSRTIGRLSSRMSIGSNDSSSRLASDASSLICSDGPGRHLLDVVIRREPDANREAGGSTALCMLVRLSSRSDISKWDSLSITRSNGVFDGVLAMIG